MAEKSCLGSKIRAWRRREGFSQAGLAKRLNISPSYLNLIEHDHRPLSASLLIKLAQQFDLDLRKFAEQSDARLAAELTEAFGDPLFEAQAIPEAELRELVSTTPTVARAVAQLYQAYRVVRGSATDLALKLSADLALPGVDRARLPTEEVSTFIQSHMNHFPKLEDAATQLIERAGLEQGDLLHGMSRHLERQYRIETRLMHASAEIGVVRRYDPERRVLWLSESLPGSSRAFQLGHQLALLTEPELLTELASDRCLTTDASRALCRVILANYFAGAVVMPYEDIAAAAIEERHDVELLQNRFGANFEMVCHRLTTLQRPGAEGVPFHFVRVDIAGNVSKWFSASGIQIARYGGSCPRWNVHTAFLTPGLITVQLSRAADGQAYFSIARTIKRAARGYHVPRSVQAVTIGCTVENAHQLIYADSVDLENLDAAVPIGSTCRLCQQPDCEQRVLPPIHHPLEVDENTRGHSFYNPVRRVPGL